MTSSNTPIWWSEKRSAPLMKRSVTLVRISMPRVLGPVASVVSSSSRSERVPFIRHAVTPLNFRRECRGSGNNPLLHGGLAARLMVNEPINCAFAPFPYRKRVASASAATDTLSPAEGAHAVVHLGGNTIVADDRPRIAQAERLALDHEAPQRVAGVADEAGASRVLAPWLRSYAARAASAASSARPIRPSAETCSCAIS